MSERKVALITGATRGIGKEIALELAKNGFDIAVNYRSMQDDMEDLKKEIKMWRGMLIYLLLYYCLCINLVRQGMALAICFFAWHYAIKKQLIKFLSIVERLFKNWEENLQPKKLVKICKEH